jgi:hypothetical protein
VSEEQGIKLIADFIQERRRVRRIQALSRRLRQTFEGIDHGYARLRLALGKRRFGIEIYRSLYTTEFSVHECHGARGHGV